MLQDHPFTQRGRARYTGRFSSWTTGRLTLGHTAASAPSGAGVGVGVGAQGGNQSQYTSLHINSWSSPFSLLGEGAERRGRALGGGSHCVGPT